MQPMADYPITNYKPPITTRCEIFLPSAGVFVLTDHPAFGDS
jgi:hypothetical protein